MVLCWGRTTACSPANQLIYLGCDSDLPLECLVVFNDEAPWLTNQKDTNLTSPDTGLPLNLTQAVSAIRMQPPHTCRHALLRYMCWSFAAPCDLGVNGTGLAGNWSKPICQSVCLDIHHACEAFLNPSSLLAQIYLSCNSTAAAEDACFTPPEPPPSIPVTTCLEGACCRPPYGRNEQSQECGIACPVDQAITRLYSRSILYTQFAGWCLDMAVVPVALIWWFTFPPRRHFPRHLPMIPMLLGVLVNTAASFAVFSGSIYTFNCADETTFSTGANDSTCLAQAIILQWASLSESFLNLYLAVFLFSQSFESNTLSRVLSSRAACLILYPFALVLMPLAFVIPGVVLELNNSGLGFSVCTLNGTGPENVSMILNLWIYPLTIFISLWLILSLALIARMYLLGGWFLLRRQIRMLCFLVFFALLEIQLPIVYYQFVFQQTGATFGAINNWIDCVANQADNVTASELCPNLDENLPFNAPYAVWSTLAVGLIPSAIAITLCLSNPYFWLFWKNLILRRDLPDETVPFSGMEEHNQRVVERIERKTQEKRQTLESQ